jgi:hypothetical protein
MMSEEQVAEVSAEATQSVEETQGFGDWRDSIPAEVRDHTSLRHITDVGALAKSYVHAQQMIGADKVAIPGKHATDDDWNEVYTRLGRPEDPNGYELDTSTVGDTNVMDDGTLNWYKQVAHKAGLTPQQAQVVFDEYNQLTGQQMSQVGQDVETRISEAEMELKREFGSAFDDRMQLGSSVLAEFGAEELSEVELADGTRLGDNPDAVRMLVRIGEFLRDRTGEDSFAGPKTSIGMTPDEAKQRLDDLTAPNSPYWDPRHPERQWYVNEALKYRQMMTGE